MRQENIDNAYARYVWLLEGIKNPGLISDSQVAYLCGQNKFSELMVVSKFSSLSLNTLKAAANKCLAVEAPDGKGFMYLSELRSTLYSKLKDRSSARTVAGKKSRSKTLLKKATEERKQADELNVILTRAYGELFSNINGLLHDGETSGKTKARLENILRKHSETYGVVLLPVGEEERAGLSVIEGGQS